jgi:hypothetical protein
MSEDEKAIFQGVDWHCNLIFLASVGPKCDSGDVENIMFQGVAWICEIINCLLVVPKFDLGEVEKALLQWVAPFILASSKCKLGEAKKAMLLVFSQPCEHIFCNLAVQNATTAESKTP